MAEIKLLSKEKKKYKITVDVGSKGTRQRKSCIFYGTYKQAETYSYEFQKKHRLGMKNISDTIKFDELKTLFINNYCKNNLGIKTINGYESMLEKICKYIGNMPVKDIDNRTLLSLYSKLRKGERKEKVSTNTMKHYYNIINLIFNFAKKWGYVSKNPNEDVEKPKIKKKLIKCYNKDEVINLIEALDKECLKYQALIILAIDSGIRKSEQLALTWNDVDFQNHIISISKSIDVVKGKYIEKPTKNDTSNRNIVISEKTTKILEKFKKEEQERLGINFNDNNRIFLSSKSNEKPIYPTTCNRILEKIAKKNNLPIYNWHSLRHSCASLQIALGIHSKVIQDRLGHSSLLVTTSTYSHIFQENRVEVANKFDEVFSNL